ncbi:MAG: heparinase II/III family protein, partial [Chloroflexota bacterium]
MSTSKAQLQQWLRHPAPETNLVERIRESSGTPIILEALRQAAPDLTHIEPMTYTLYRQFEQTGEREGYEQRYFRRRAQLTRAVLETISGNTSLRDSIHDLLWSICEETSWVMPAHEEQGPDYWDIDPPIKRTTPLGAHTSLTREPDSIDLFAAETGASLAETIHWIGGDLAPEVVQRVRQEIQRRIFKPYLAYAREHWWFQGALNWNGVCNGAVGLAFMRLEHDLATLTEALEMVLEGFETYIATGFEQDGGSVEGVGYWRYGLMYYVTLGELLHERTAGQLDLLDTERMRSIAAYPRVMYLSPGNFANFGDANEDASLAPGITQRIAKRTGVDELRALINRDRPIDKASASAAKLAITLRNAAWWDGQTVEPLPLQDAFLPHCEVAKMVGQSNAGQPIALIATAGNNDGHHSHTDVGSFILHVDGESLICEIGRGRYSREYFRQSRYETPFTNSFGHSLPRIGGHLQSPGPEFNGHKQFYGTIVEHDFNTADKYVTIDMQNAYDV